MITHVVSLIIIDMNENDNLINYGISAIDNLKYGKSILLVDGENRENEGDFIFFRQKKMTEKDMALIIRECSGIVSFVLYLKKQKNLIQK